MQTSAVQFQEKSNQHKDSLSNNLHPKFSTLFVRTIKLYGCLITYIHVSSKCQIIHKLNNRARIEIIERKFARDRSNNARSIRQSKIVTQSHCRSLDDELWIRGNLECFNAILKSDVRNRFARLLNNCRQSRNPSC